MSHRGQGGLSKSVSYLGIDYDVALSCICACDHSASAV